MNKLKDLQDSINNLEGELIPYNIIKDYIYPLKVWLESTVQEPTVNSYTIMEYGMITDHGYLTQEAAIKEAAIDADRSDFEYAVLKVVKVLKPDKGDI